MIKNFTVDTNGKQYPKFWARSREIEKFSSLNYRIVSSL